MKYSLGDRVLMKRTGEEGIITAFLSKQIIEVEVGDIRFPVYLDEVDHPYLKWFTDPAKPKVARRINEILPEKAATNAQRLSRGIYLSFLPQFATGTSDDIIESFRIHLLNETADNLLYAYHARTAGGETILQLNGALHPFANIYLHTLSLEALNAQPRFYWTVALKDKPDNGIQDVLRIRPAQLIRHISALIQDGEPSFSILLTQDAEAVPVAPSVIPVQMQRTAQQAVQLHTTAVEVLDLHLSDEEKTTGAAEIMSLQMRLLEQKLDAAYVAGIEKMTVIHGIGNGILRDAVHDIFRQTPFITHFSNHWMAAYGWGATEVFFGTR